MLKYFTSLGCLGLMALSCSSKSGVEGGGGTGGGGFIIGAGGSGASNGDSGTGNTGPLTGGKSVATAAILAQIEDSACAGGNAELETNPAMLQFVVDVSGSMTDIPNGSTGQNKWQITQAALTDAIQNQLPDNAGVGILFFPNMNTVPNHNDTAVPPIESPTNTCVKTDALIPIAPLGAANSAQRTAIAQGLANATANGGTPTDDAFEYAYDNGIVPAIQKYGFFTPFMVLITDGQPTILLHCEGTGQTSHPVDWHPIVDYIGKIFTAIPTVKTFVIGSPGSEAQSSTGADGRPWLSQAARTGGTPITPNCQDSGPNYCHFDMTQSLDFATDLSNALKDIVSTAISCAFKIPPPTNGGLPDPTKINIVYEQNVINSQPEQQWLIGETSDPTCNNGAAEGWYLSKDPTDPANLDKMQVVLCPATCRTIQMDKYAVVRARQGCQTVVPIN